jgi:hypothetical protein
MGHYLTTRRLISTGSAFEMTLGYRRAVVDGRVEIEMTATRQTVTKA